MKINFHQNKYNKLIIKSSNIFLQLITRQHSKWVLTRSVRLDPPADRS